MVRSNILISISARWVSRRVSSHHHHRWWTHIKYSQISFKSASRIITFEWNGVRSSRLLVSSSPLDGHLIPRAFLTKNRLGGNLCFAGKKTFAHKKPGEKWDLKFNDIRCCASSGKKKQHLISNVTQRLTFNLFNKHLRCYFGCARDVLISGKLISF